jgi:hypothetical protein
MNIIEAVKYQNDNPKAIIQNKDAANTFLLIIEYDDINGRSKEIYKEVDSETRDLEFSDFFSVWEVWKPGK